MKSSPVAYILLIFTCGLGLHRFYLDRPLSGVLYFFSCGGFGLWFLIDLFLIPEMVRECNRPYETRHVIGGGGITINIDSSSGRRRKREVDDNPFDFQ